MCGVAASVVSADGAERACALMDHRGVRTSSWAIGDGAIFHRRLPIVGTGAEHDQPVRRPSSRWTVAFVGEILDFRERDPLAECDVDTVVDAWESLGPRGFSTFDGFWAVVAYHDLTGELHLLCDYLAQKPLYYRTDQPACASEPAACASFGPVTPDRVYLSACVKWGYCPEPWRTPYVEVRRVLPGEHVVLRDGERPEGGIVDSLSPRSCDLGREIELAVRRRVLSSDVPVACLLSGGLDSSIVYTLASRYADVRPYYAKEAGGDDRLAQSYVAAVAGRAPIVRTAWGGMDRAEAVSIMQEPVDLGSLLPQVALSRVVRERVCLTGDGADELFGGYGRAARYDSQFSDIFHELVCWHLPRLDRVMMRQQIEVRSPFLARRVVEGSLVLPRDQRTGKKFLRDLYRDALPPGLADQAKVPLRSSVVDANRESVSAEMVRMFVL